MIATVTTSRGYRFEIPTTQSALAAWTSGRLVKGKDADDLDIYIPFNSVDNITIKEQA